MRSEATYMDPITGPAPRTAVRRWSWRAAHRMRSMMGVRRGFSVDGVYYKETSTELLSRALSRKGSGAKEYRVTFRDGSKLLIHCTLKRQFADINGPALLPHFQRIAALIRPGMRVLVMPCSTGNTAAWMSARVGASGAVVAIDTDEESITYAAARYGAPNMAFEVGGPSALTGEIDASFDAAMFVSSDDTQLQASALAEAWRVVAFGGWLLVGAPAVRDRQAILDLVAGVTTPTKVDEGSVGDETSPSVVIDCLTAAEEPFHLILARKLTD